MPEGEDLTEPLETATNSNNDELFTEDSLSDQTECSDYELLVIPESEMFEESIEPVEINSASDELFTEDVQSVLSEYSDCEEEKEGGNTVVPENDIVVEVIETSSSDTTNDKVSITESSSCVDTDSELSDCKLDETVIMLDLELTEPEPVLTLCSDTGDSAVLVASSLETTPLISTGSPVLVGEELVTGASLLSVEEAVKYLNPVFEESSVAENPVHQDSATGIQESSNENVIEDTSVRAMETNDKLTADTAQNTDDERFDHELDGEDVMPEGEKEFIISHSPASADLAGIILAAGCTDTTVVKECETIDYRGGDHQESTDVDPQEPNEVYPTVTSNEELVGVANKPLVDRQPVKATATSSPSKCDGTASLFKSAIGDIVYQKSARSVQPTRRAETSPNKATAKRHFILPHLLEQDFPDSNIEESDSHVTQMTSTCSSALAISQSSSPDTSSVFNSAASIDLESQFDEHCWIEDDNALSFASSQEQVDVLAPPVLCNPSAVIDDRHGSVLVVSKRPNSQQERKKQFRSEEGESSSSRMEKSKQSERSQSKKQEGKPRWYSPSMSQWETLDMLPHQQEDTACKTEVTAPSEACSQTKKEQRKTTSARVAMDGKKSKKPDNQPVVVDPTGVGTIPHFVSFAENAVLSSIDGVKTFHAICYTYKRKYRLHRHRNVRFEIEDIVGKSEAFSVVLRKDRNPSLVQVDCNVDIVPAKSKRAEQDRYRGRGRGGKRCGSRQEKRHKS